MKLLNSMTVYVRETQKARNGSILGSLATVADDPEVRLVCALRDLNARVIQVMKYRSLADTLTVITSEEAAR
jgi:hypothetical protein